MPSSGRATRRAGTLLVGAAMLAGVVATAVGIVAAGVAAFSHPLLYGCVSAGALVVLGVAGALLRRGTRRVRPATLLELDLPTLPGEEAPPPWARLAGRPPALSLPAVLEALRRAGEDPRVVGLLVRVGIDHGGLAQIQELRDALGAFAAAGKHTIAVADTFGELGGAHAGYYLATACREIVLQPGGTLGLIGLAREANFVRGALARLGIEPVFEARHEYKSAANRLMNDALSAPERAQEQQLLDSQLGQIVAGIAAGRALAPAAVRALVERGPFLAREALELGLVDALGHADAAEERARAATGARGDPVPLAAYTPGTRRDRRRRADGKPLTIATITATGNIVRRASTPLPTPAGRPLDAGALARAIDEAATSPKIAAILLRIDSPGGSAVAAETIHRALVRARARETPVVVSMGNVAASGGYYIAVAADRIVAQPGTITGSIGVFAGKFVLAAAKERLGVTTDEVHAGAHALMASANRDFTPAERERFAAGIDETYATFLQRVGEGRHLDAAALDTVARGRVFTGADAHALGLVDTLGGYAAARDELRQVLALSPTRQLRFVSHPRRRRLGAGVWRSALADAFTAGRNAWRTGAGSLRLPPGLDRSEI